MLTSSNKTDHTAASRLMDLKKKKKNTCRSFQFWFQLKPRALIGRVIFMIDLPDFRIKILLHLWPLTCFGNLDGMRAVILLSNQICTSAQLFTVSSPLKIEGVQNSMPNSKPTNVDFVSFRFLAGCLLAGMCFTPTVLTDVFPL